MVKVCIEKQLLPVADMLVDIFTMRMAEIGIRGDGTAKPAGDCATGSASPNGKIPQSYDVFLCSAEFAKTNGGTPGIVDLARGMKAKKLMVIGHDESDQFFVSHEMNGKLIRLSMPKSAQIIPAATNYSLQMAVTLCLDSEHVAVADPNSRQLMALASRVAVTDVTVFINGPTGTGKEVLAKFIHNQSSRKDKAFVAVNCAAIPENMLEAILFGHEKGAFTGASTANKGIFRAADGGTLLLDEISEMPLSLQAKLLRALQERKVTPLGSQREVDVDVRSEQEQQKFESDFALKMVDTLVSFNDQQISSYELPNRFFTKDELYCFGLFSKSVPVNPLPAIYPEDGFLLFRGVPVPKSVNLTTANLEEIEHILQTSNTTNLHSIHR